MKNKYYSRQQRQLKYLVKKLNILLQETEGNLKTEISKLTSKIKFLVSKLNGVLSGNRMKKIFVFHNVLICFDVSMIDINK